MVGGGNVGVERQVDELLLYDERCNRGVKVRG